MSNPNAQRRANPLPADVIPIVGHVNVGAGLPRFILAPSGSYPGVTAWLYTAGVTQPTMVTITQIFNDPTGLYARVTTRVAAAPHPFWWPSQSGGLEEALAPFSQGGSVRTTSSSPARSMNPMLTGTVHPQYKKPTVHADYLPPLPTDWLPATYFPGPPFPTARRWVKIGAHTGPGSAYYEAILFTQWGATQQPVIAVLKADEDGEHVEQPLKAKVYNEEGFWPGYPGGPPGPAPNPVPRQSWTRRRNPVAKLSGSDSFSIGGGSTASTMPPTLQSSNMTPPQWIPPTPTFLATCMVDIAALRLHCPGSLLHGVEVVDLEGDGADEGDVVAVSYVDPTTGLETIGQFVVMADQGVAWWEHDGHCCESCALGHDCEAA